MTTSTTTTTRVTFIDSRVENYQTIIDSLDLSTTTVVILDESTDGIQQITDYLTSQSDVGAVDIVSGVDIISHGAAGEIILGSTVLSSENIADYQAQLAEIGSHLTDNGDILLYGCDVAAGDAGQTFIAALADATRADVAASTDLTGSAALGGDWVLEASTGTIETAAIVDLAYGDVLDGGGSYAPSITSATYDASTGVLIVTGTNFVAIAGSNNDITVTKLKLVDSSTNYTLTSGNVERTSSTSFSVTLNVADKLALVSILNKNGTSGLQHGNYDLDAAEGWNGSESNANNANTTVTVSNVDTVAPTATITHYNPVNGTTNADILVYRVTFTEAVQNVTADDFTVTGSTATVQSVIAVSGTNSYDVTVSGGNLNNFNGTVTLGFSTLITGTTDEHEHEHEHFIQNITDVAGNNLDNSPAATGSYTVDNVAPTVPTFALTHDTANGDDNSDLLTNNAALTFGAKDDDATREYKIGSGDWTNTYAAPTTDDIYTVLVKDTDAAGNTATSNLTFTLDKSLTAPTVALTHDTANGDDNSDLLTNNAALTFGAKDDDATRQYKIGSGDWTNTYAAPTTDDIYTVLVKDTDAAGNSKEASLTFFKLDTTIIAPTVTQLSVAHIHNDGRTFVDLSVGDTNTDTATTTVTVTDGVNIQSAALIEGIWQADVSSLGSQLTASVSITDLAGNSATSETPTTLDTTGPTSTQEVGSLTLGGALVDGNNDGVGDALQSNVSTIPTQVGDENITLAAGTSIKIIDISNTPSILDNPAAPIDSTTPSQPYGALGFTLSNVVDHVDLSTYLPGTWSSSNGVWTNTNGTADTADDVLVNGFWKNVSTDTTPSWINVATNMDTVEGGALKIDFSIADNGLGDSDSRSGVITDPDVAGYVKPALDGENISYQDSNETDTFLTTTGQLDGSTLAGLSIQLTYSLDGNGTGTYGDLTVNAAGAYTYTPNSEAINALITTEQDIFTVSVTDGATDSLGNVIYTTQTLTVALNGVNDDADISIVSGGDYNVVEAGGADKRDHRNDHDGSDSEHDDYVAGDVIASGTLSITDVDTDENHFIAQSNAAGYYGTFQLAADGVWSYALESDKLGGYGSTSMNGTDTLTVRSADGFTSQDIVVNITGANDAPVVATAISDNSVTAYSATSFTDLLSSLNATSFATTFHDVDNTSLKYTVKIGDNDSEHNSASWLTYTPGLLGTQGSFSGAPPTNNNVGNVNVEVTATDGSLSVKDHFKVTITGNTTVNGTSSADTLYGTDKADTITGGAGNDILTGNEGKDIFSFTNITEGNDTIKDFKHGKDKIDLSAIDAKTNVAGDQAFAFITASKATTTANSITWSTQSGNTILHIDNDAVAGDDLTITLVGTNLGLAATDFVL